MFLMLFVVYLNTFLKVFLRAFGIQNVIINNIVEYHALLTNVGITDFILETVYFAYKHRIKMIKSNMIIEE